MKIKTQNRNINEEIATTEHLRYEVDKNTITFIYLCAMCIALLTTGRISDFVQGQGEY